MYRLVAATESAADWSAVEDDRELLADFSVVIGDDVARVRVDATDTGDLHRDAGFLLNLADCCLSGGLADVLCSAGHRPEAVIRTLDHQELSVVVSDDGGNCHDQAVRFRSLWVIEVIPLRHAAWLRPIRRQNSLRTC